MERYIQRTLLDASHSKFGVSTIKITSTNSPAGGRIQRSDTDMAPSAITSLGSTDDAGLSAAAVEPMFAIKHKIWEASLQHDWTVSAVSTIKYRFSLSFSVVEIKQC
jgi:hypothetical protein